MKRKIIFADDQTKVLRGLQRMLHDENRTWDMTFVANPFEVTKLLRQNHYDVALLDVEMPGKSGLEILSEIKADPRMQDMEVVMFTGSQDRHLKHQALELGAADILSKPVVKEDLLARVSSALRAKSYHDELRAQNALLERQLLQSQKMEVIGTLATGIAHDFKGIIAAIMEYSSLAAHKLATDSPAQESFREIQAICRRAEKMVQQILRFAQEQAEISPELCDLSLVIDESLELLRASFPETVKIEWNGSETSRQIRADLNQIHQLLMNLCINAVRAMGNEGVLRISLSEDELQALGKGLSRTGNAGARPPVGANSILADYETQSGPYLRLEVSNADNGMKQDALTTSKIMTAYSRASMQHTFEPLSGNRGVHMGSLGLSVAHRIVKNHAGMLIESTHGKSTTFLVYLPCV